MSSGLAIVLLIAIMLTLLAVALTFVLLRRRMSMLSRHVVGPGYRHDLSVVKYTGHAEVRFDTKPAEEPPGRKVQMDPRSQPLPRCESCGSALAYGDTRCAKCGFERHRAVEKVI